jgi:hypothetical protein
LWLPSQYPSGIMLKKEFNIQIVYFSFCFRLRCSPNYRPLIWPQGPLFQNCPIPRARLKLETVYGKAFGWKDFPNKGAKMSAWDPTFSEHVPHPLKPSLVKHQGNLRHMTKYIDKFELCATPHSQSPSIILFFPYVFIWFSIIHCYLCQCKI